MKVKVTTTVEHVLTFKADDIEYLKGILDDLTADITAGKPVDVGNAEDTARALRLHALYLEEGFGAVLVQAASEAVVDDLDLDYEDGECVSVNSVGEVL